MTTAFPPSTWARWRRPMAILLLATLALAALPGCDMLAYVGNAFHDDGIPPRHTLAKGTVAVLVDDPDHRLGDPSLASVAAAWAGDGIRKNVGKVQVIPIQKVVELAQKTGDDFATMPVDQIGSELGATQVVYVVIESAGVTGDPGLYRPQAVVRVNVIDVATGKRVFPSGNLSPDASAQGVAGRGEPVTVNLQYSTSDQNPVAETSVLMRTLAQEIGVEVAKVFYKHAPPAVPKYND